jgi:metallophosphoesterase (TIGR00282 family)
LHNYIHKIRNFELSKDISLIFVGDVVGEIGLNNLLAQLPAIKEKHSANAIIVNGENVWDGKGINEEEANKLFEAGVHVITTGNHIWENWKSRPLLGKDRRVIRPMNYPAGNAGYGFTTFTADNGTKVGVLQLQGRTFMSTIDCPFNSADFAIEKMKADTNITVVDFHAEATAEKISMGWYLDGKVSAVIGTHTHVQTADAQILPQGTGYITDVGMTGPYDSVLGMRKDIAIKRFQLQTAHKFQVAEGDLKVAYVHLNIDGSTGQTMSITAHTTPKFDNQVI